MSYMHRNTVFQLDLQMLRRHELPNQVISKFVPYILIAEER